MNKVSSICKGSAEGKNHGMKIPKVLLRQSNGEASISEVDLLRRIMFIASRTSNRWEVISFFKGFEDPKS